MIAAALSAVAGGAGVVAVRALPRHVPALRGTVAAVDGPTELRSQAATVALGDGTVLVWGGREVGPDSGHVFDPTTRRWTDLPAAPGPPRFGAATVWTGTEAIIWGGSTATDPLSLDPGGIAWNPSAGSWRELPAAPHGLLHGRAVAFDEGVLVTGGQRLDTDDPLDLWFDLRDETWTAVPAPVHVLNLIRLGDRLVGTGPIRPVEGSDSGPRWSVVAFDPERRGWTQAAPDVATEWLALAPGPYGSLTAVTAGAEGVRGHVLVEGRWDRVATAHGVPSFTTLEPVGYPPASVWTGDRLILGGQGSLISWEPDRRRFEAVSDPRIRTFGGTVVWTGEQVVSLTNQSSEGWTWTPEDPTGR